jgi:hypothetical protein
MAAMPLCEALANGTAESEDGLCMLCPAGSYRYGLGESCRECPGDVGQLVRRTVATFWVLGGLGLICWRQVSRQGGRLPPGRAASQVLATVLGHTQLMAVLLVVPWRYPAWVLTTLEVPASFFGADLLAMFHVDCSEGHSPQAFKWRWLLSQGSVLAFLLLLLVMWKVGNVMSQPSLADRSLHRAIVLYGLFLSSIVRGGASVHDCVQHGEYYVLDHSPEIACDYENDTYQLFALISGAMLQFIMLLPVLIFSRLHKKHRRTRRDGGLGKQSDVQRFGWLFVRYTHSMYWWEVINMYKTIITMFFAVWLSHSPGKCTGLVGGCIVAHGVMLHMFQPMECTDSEHHSLVAKTRKGNRLQILTVLSQLLFLFVSMTSALTGPGSSDHPGTCEVILGTASEELAAPTGCGLPIGAVCHQDNPCRGNACPAGHCRYIQPFEHPRSPLLNVTVGLLVFATYFAPLLGGAALLYTEQHSEGMPGSPTNKRKTAAGVDPSSWGRGGDLSPPRRGGDLSPPRGRTGETATQKGEEKDKDAVDGDSNGAGDRSTSSAPGTFDTEDHAGDASPVAFENPCVVSLR